ncbi:MAG: translation initiation factor IF-2 subunit gamma [Candidatus Aenigmarchaeota archaeon]|nr:translation initiation factor IF-2 subunit gamma [Candidatus Aenigmarchaeota archaeon]
MSEFYSMKTEVNEKLIPEANIGTVGHVEHGKCIALDEDILINNHLTSGVNLKALAESDGKLIRQEGGERVYELPRLYTYSLDSDFNLVRARPLIFLQKYKGPMFEIKTRSGRSIKVTPSHPFLVNRMGSLKWVCANSLNPKTDQVAVFAGDLPEQTEIKLGDFIGSMSKEYIVLVYEDFIGIKNKSGNFVNFEKFTIEDFNKLRIICGLSLSKLSARVGYSDSYLGEVLSLKRRGLSDNVKRALSKFFSLSKPVLSKDEIVFLDRKKGAITKIRDPKAMDENIVRWFSFVHSEGTSTEARISVSQKNYKNLLSEFLSISKDKFGVEFKKVSDIDYHLNNKAFVRYLKEKYFFCTGNVMQSPICRWVLSLDKKLTATFLKWFIILEGSFEKSREIVVIQRNKHDINMLVYMLNKLGIRACLGDKTRFATNSPKKIRRKYYTLSICGRENIANFIRLVGIEDKKKAALMNRSISGLRPDSRKSLEVVFIDHRILNTLCKLLGWDKKRIRQKSWFYAYNACYNTNRFSKDKFLEFLKDIKIACKNSNNTAINRISAQLQALYHKNISFDVIKGIEKTNYNGEIIDLSVPEHQNFIAGFGGIISHNTTLLQALSGKWTGTHSEEQKRGLTIKLGYADVTIYKCEKCEGFESYSTSPKCLKHVSDSVPLRTVSLVDAPGHETLMATVLAGAALMDGALFLIAANQKCPQPQTREHLAALNITGVEKIVIVQNKIDIVPPEKLKENYEQIKNFVNGTVAESAPIVPISAQQRINLDALIETVEKTIPTPKRDPKKNPKMLVVRTFDVNKPGYTPEKLSGGVLGGSLLQGEFKVGDEIEIRPGLRVERENKIFWEPLFTKVAGLHKRNMLLDKAGPGGLVGLMTELDPALTKADSLAGSVVGHPNKLPSVLHKLHIETDLMESIIGAEDTMKVDNIRTNEPLMLTIGTSRTVGIVTSARKDNFEISLKLPVCVEKGNRVAISRQIANRWRLIGSGVIK